MKFHPYAEVFPLIQGEDFDQLVADIAAFGLREPIWTYEGKILDGRNRYLACQKAGKEPDFREFKGTEQGALAHVVSVNMRRRHLTVEQRAMAAARISNLSGGRPVETASRDAVSQSDAAEQMDVSRSSVQRAKKVVEKGSKALQQAVEKGEVPLKKAAAVTELPKAEQLAAATKPAEAKPLEVEPEPEWTAEDEAEYMAQEEAGARARIEAAIAADDKLAEALEQIKQLSAELAVVKRSRDHYMNQAGEAVRLVKARDREIAKLKKQIARQAA